MEGEVAICIDIGAVLVLYCTGTGSGLADVGEIITGAVTLRLDKAAGCGPTARRGIDARGIGLVM